VSYLEYTGWVMLAALVIAIITVAVALFSAADDYKESEKQDE
jgi:hypothetical protein